LSRLSTVHKEICAMRDVEPQSTAGREIAERLLDDFTGDEAEGAIIKKFDP